jgi:hypothetical protein
MRISLRADRKHIAYYQHPDHQHRGFWSSFRRVRVVSRKLLVHPIKIENAVDLPNQMIGRHRLVEIERVEELTLFALSPHIIDRSANRSPEFTESRFNRSLNESFATQSSDNDQIAQCSEMS